RDCRGGHAHPGASPHHYLSWRRSLPRLASRCDDTCREGEAMTRTPSRAYGTPATRLHAGRIVLVLVLLAGAGLGVWLWAFRHKGGTHEAAPEKSLSPGWTAAQLHYEKPEVRPEAPPPAPVDTISPQLAAILAKLRDMQAEIDALKNRKPPTA